MSDLGRLSVGERLADAAELTDAEKVLRVLLDRRWHTAAEIRELCGGLTVNSRVSDLRRRGHLVDCRRVASRVYEYRLVASASERAELEEYPNEQGGTPVNLPGAEPSGEALVPGSGGEPRLAPEDLTEVEPPPEWFRCG